MPIKWKKDAQGNDYVESQKPRGRKPGSGATPPAIQALTGDSRELSLPTEIIPEEGTSVSELITASSRNLLNGFPLDELSERILRQHQYDPAKVVANPAPRSKIITSILDELSAKEAAEHLKMGRPIGPTTSGAGSVIDALSGEKDKRGLPRQKHE